MNQKSFISLSSDGWSTNHMRGVYCNCITAHFIDDKFQMQEVVLDVSDLADRHTSVNLLSKWSQIVSDFAIHDKLLALTTDGASDYTSASRRFAKVSYWCSCHRLHSISNKLINENVDLQLIMIKGKSIISFVE
jgi:hypothetical protein